jgi:hypothetical protein
MKNIREVLNQTIQLKEFAIKRAKEMFDVLGRCYKAQVRDVDYDVDRVLVTLEQITNCDYPDTDCIELKISHLEMSETEWANYVEEKRKEILADQQKRIEEQAKRKLAEKISRFESLKKELELNHIKIEKS